MGEMMGRQDHPPRLVSQEPSPSNSLGNPAFTKERISSCRRGEQDEGAEGEDEERDSDFRETAPSPELFIRARPLNIVA